VNAEVLAPIIRLKGQLPMISMRGMFWAMHSDEYESRRSIRLPYYDYTQGGGYFVTICSEDRRCVLGDVRSEQVQLSQLGRIALACWLEIPSHFPDIILDEFVIMPNHVHGILVLRADVGVPNNPRSNVGAQNFAPVADEVRIFHVLPNSLGSIIRSYKAAVTQNWRKQRPQLSGSIWQRNYHEHVIRDERDLLKKREYIINNPMKWELDEYYND
jgi:REP element-mobilizing transposase RayT